MEHTRVASDDSILPQTIPSSNPPGSERQGPVAKSDITEVFRVEESPLLRWAVGLTGRRELAEEVVQEAFLRLHQHWDTVDNPRAWLYRCVRNLALNELRDTRKEQPTATPPDTDGGAILPDEALGRLEAAGMLRLLVAEMEEPDRDLVRLKYDDHLSYAQLAQRTGLSVGNVGYRLHHILKHLADALRRAGIESALG